MGLRLRDLRAGWRYLHNNGSWIRTIDHIVGDNVYWHDDCGPGNCTRNVFLKRCSGFALEQPEPPQEPENQANDPMTPEEKAEMAELRQCILLLSKDLAAIMETNATIIAKLILPLWTAEPEQEQLMLDCAEGLRSSAESLRQRADLLLNPPV